MGSVFAGFEGIGVSEVGELGLGLRRLGLI